MKAKGSQKNVYDKLLTSRQRKQGHTPSLIQSDKKLKELSKTVYATPSPSISKAKLDLPPAQEESQPTSSYTDLEVSRYLSCIIQLKDHINYLNILMDNVLDALDHFRIDLNTKFTEYKTARQGYERYDSDRFEFDMRLKSMIKVLEEALYKNTDAITQFANITGHQRVPQPPIQHGLQLCGAWTPRAQPEVSTKVSKDSATTASRGKTEVRKGREDEQPENVIESEEEKGSLVAAKEKQRTDDFKIVRQENKCLKEEIKRAKEKKRRYKRLLRESDENVKNLSSVNNQYDSQLIEVEKEKEQLKADLALKLKQAEEDIERLSAELKEKEGAEDKRVQELTGDYEHKLGTLNGKYESVRDQLERLTEELAHTKQENDDFKTRRHPQQFASSEPKPSFTEYHEQAIKYKTLSEEKDVSLKEEKERNEMLAKEVQRARNELFAVQLEKTKKDKELFTAVLQLKELKSALELEQTKRKQLEEDRNHYARIVDIGGNKGSEEEAGEGGREDHSLLAAIQELCLLVLSKRKESTMSQKTKNLIKEIFQDNLIYLLDLYDKYMCDLGERNTKLEKLIRTQYERNVVYEKTIDELGDFIAQILIHCDSPAELLDLEQIKELLGKKHEEVVATQQGIAQDNAELAKFMAALDVQMTQARELLETELGKEAGGNKESETCPYKHLKEFYKASIEELQRQNAMLQKKAGGDADLLGPESKTIMGKEAQISKLQKEVEELTQTVAKTEREHSQEQESCNMLERKNEELALTVAELEQKLKTEIEGRKALTEQMKSIKSDKNMLVGMATSNAQALEEYILEALNKAENQEANEDS